MQEQIFLKIGLSDKDKLCSTTSGVLKKKGLLKEIKARRWEFVSPFEFWRTTRSYISTTHFWSQAWSPISLACLMGIHITLMDSVTAHFENHCWLMPLAQEKKIFEWRKSTHLSSLSSSWRIFYGVSLSNATNKSYRILWNARNDGLSIRQKGQSYWLLLHTDDRVDRSSVIDNPLCVDLSDPS